MKKNKIEFLDIIDPIINNECFKETKNIKHHDMTRYDHCFRVAYYTYIITKKFNLKYKEATEAAMLHDFFTDEVTDYRFIGRLRKHPNIACENAEKYFELTKLQKDIIKKHMFPITLRPPRYLESWIVDIVDDIVAIYEKSFSVKSQLKAATTFLMLLLLNSIQ